MPKFDVVLKGTVLPGTARADVSNTLATLLKQPVEVIEQLLSGRPTTLRAGVDLETGQKYLGALSAAGAACALEPESLALDANLLRSQPSASSALPKVSEDSIVPIGAAIGRHLLPNKETDQGLSDKWRRIFDLIDQAGGSDLPNLPNLTFWEKQRIYRNIPSLLFGPLYYFFKGMWLRGFTLLFFAFDLAIALFSIAEYFHIPVLAQISRGTSIAFFAIFANLDYYKKRRNGDEASSGMFALSLALLVFVIVAGIYFDPSMERSNNVR